MRSARRGLITVVALAVVTAGSVTGWVLLHGSAPGTPGCTVTTPPGASSSTTAAFTLTPEQARNAATIAAVAAQMGMPDHAVTVALATALQESKLRNLPSGDRDSIGLFQQRPSQGWGTPQQILDPVYAATAFYKRLNALSGWEQLPVTEAAQQVQHSAAPSAYAQWEPKARATAAALTGQYPAALACHNMVVAQPSADLVATANTELGTAALSGPHPTARGWEISSWLVAHSVGVGVDQVTFDGQTWTAASGSWSQTGTADSILSLHQVSAPPAPA